MARGRRRRGSRRPARTAAHRPAIDFARRLGYRFRRLEGLEEALTHGSYRNGGDGGDYERLEFLGDAALGMVVTEAMHFQKPTWSGQRRQETKGEVVSNQSLAGAARALGLDKGIRVGPGVSAGVAVRSSERVLANVFEAVLGAAYLDGGLAAARGIVGSAFDRKLRTLRLTPPRAGGGPLGGAGRLVRAACAVVVRLARRVLFLRIPSERALRRTFARPSLLRAALDTGAEPDSASRRRGRRGRRGGRGGRRGPGHRRAGGAEGAGRQALRFLGRDVMHLITAEELHRSFPEWDEGRMTLARMRLQEREFTGRLAEHWTLGSGDAAAGDAEALLGALYLDGQLGAARRSLAGPFREAFDDLAEPGLELLDPKTLLQNRLAKDGKEAPRYDRGHSSGKGDGQVVVAVRLQGGVVETGRGRGLKQAQKDAAQRAFDRIYGDKGEEPAREAKAHGGRGPSRRDGARSQRGSQSGRKAAPSPPAREQPEETIRTDPKENPKGALQEILVKRHGRLPVYRVISESGPEHDKTYVVEVLSGRQALGRGSGGSKRKAEAEAAAKALAAGTVD